MREKKPLRPSRRRVGMVILAVLLVTILLVIKYAEQRQVTLIEEMLRMSDHVSEGEYLEAMDMAIEFARKNPQGWEGTDIIALPGERDENYERKLTTLISVYEEASQRRPNNAKIRLNLARAYKAGWLYARHCLRNKYDEYADLVLKHSMQAFEIDSTLVQAAELTSIMYRIHFKDNEKAKEWFHKAQRARFE